ncbi:hypothetical protein ACFQ73_02170 [Amycolatopsis japonica]
MSEPEQQGQVDPMEEAGMAPEDVDAYWATALDPETFTSDDW